MFFLSFLPSFIFSFHKDLLQIHSMPGTVPGLVGYEGGLVEFGETSNG